MLRQRVITAVVLVAIVLAAVFKLPSAGFAGFLAVVLGVAIWEWTALAGLQQTVFRLVYVCLIVVSVFLAELFTPHIFLVLLPGLLFWLLAFVFVVRYPDGHQLWAKTPALMILGIFIFLPAWSGFRFLREQDFFSFHLLFLPGLVAAADIGAYFTGRAFGRHKLAARVSPNKTWEGVVGGMVCCVLVMLVMGAFLISRYVNLASRELFMLGLSALVIAVFSVVGDLFESMVKRFRDVKDSGQILPGHGGILDRIDALVAVIPLYTLMVIQFEQVVQ